MFISELKTRYPSLQVLKTFPRTGQKQVYLVNIDTYGKVILKIVKKMNPRIDREISIMRDHHFANVPKIIDFSSIQVDGEEKYYSLEEFIDGKNLTEVLKKGALPLRQCLSLLETLLKIVVELEEAHIVHRDIKPDNIILDNTGVFHLIDFGIARLLDQGSLTLTDIPVGPHSPGYAAPELFRYDKSLINSKTDLFSIGVILYEAIFGKHPFLSGDENDVQDIWNETLTVNPKYRSIPGDTDRQLFAFIQTLMMKQVTKRPPNAKTALVWYRAVCGTLSLDEKE